MSTSIQKSEQGSLVEGSIGEVALRENTRLANVIMGAAIIVLVDTSGSMNTNDAQPWTGWVPGRNFWGHKDDNPSRHDRAAYELEKLQAKYPGKVVVISFSNYTLFCPDGVPVRQDAGTNMYGALEFVKEFDETGVEIALISDGCPTFPEGRQYKNLMGTSEEVTLDKAKEYKTPINAIYAGKPTNYAAIEFMKELARVSGGQYIETDDVAEVYKPVNVLLLESQKEQE